MTLSVPPFHCNFTDTVIFFQLSFFLIVLPGTLPSSMASTFSLFQFIYLSSINFLMWTIFKAFIKFVTIFLLFYGLVFGHTPCEILTPQRWIQPTVTALEGEVLTPGLQGEALSSYLSSYLFFSILLQLFPYRYF